MLSMTVQGVGRPVVLQRGGDYVTGGRYCLVIEYRCDCCEC